MVGHASELPSELPIQLRDDLTYSLGTTIGKRDDVLGSPSAVTPQLEGPSIVFWVAIMAWTVVMGLSMMPKLSWMTLARGTKQLVQEALLIILKELSYFS